MAYATVLVHLNDERRAPRLLDFAIELAQAHSAHLIGLFVVPLPVVLNEWPDLAIAEMIENQRKSYRDEGRRIEALFRDRTRGLTKPAQWRLTDSQYSTAVGALVLHAHAADLVIVPEADPSWHLTHIFDVADAAIMESGRPFLVVPNAGVIKGNPHSVIVAWNSRRESTRAAFDAIPLMQKAAAAEVVWVDARSAGMKAGDLPSSELAAALSRHGIACEAKVIPAADGRVGDALMHYAKTSNADLLVMGAYGHSRLREFVLGGATRDVLRDMSVPVLFSH